MKSFDEAFAPGWENDFSKIPVNTTSAAQNPLVQTPDQILAGVKMPGGVGGLVGDQRNGLFKGFGMDEGRLALGGLQTLAGLWSALQSAKMAKKTFNWQKDIGEANFANQMKTYNEALDGKRRTREIVEGQTPQQSQEYYDKYKAVRNT